MLYFKPITQCYDMCYDVSTQEKIDFENSFYSKLFNKQSLYAIEACGSMHKL